MRFLVTGGAGFIGSNIVHALQERGDEAVVVDNFSSGDFNNLARFNGDVVTADVQSDAWHAKVGKVDAVFHEAALTDTTVLDPRTQMESNSEGLRSVLRFAADYKIGRVVYASSAGVYGNMPCPMDDQNPELVPHNSYGFSKMVGDSIARRFMAAFPKKILVGLRYFNVYGPREAHKRSARSMILQLAQQMQAGRRPRIFKHGEQARDFIYVKDVVSANLKALKAKKSCIVNVGTGEATSFNDIIKILNHMLGTGFEPEYFDNPYAGYQDRTQATTAYARKMIGFAAEYSAQRGIEDYIGGAKVPVGA